jgi:hypothetical protein
MLAAGTCLTINCTLYFISWIFTLVLTREPHYKNKFFQSTDVNICLTVIVSMKHKHTNKNWTTKLQKPLLKLNYVILVMFTIQRRYVCWTYRWIRPWNPTNSVLFEVIYNIWWPPLWSSGQSSWLQIQRSGFDSRRYQIFFWEVVGVKRGSLSLAMIIEVLFEEKRGSGLENRN